MLVLESDGAEVGATNRAGQRVIAQARAGRIESVCGRGQREDIACLGLARERAS